MKGGEVREPYAQSALAAGKGTYVTLDNFKEIKMTEQKKEGSWDLEDGILRPFSSSSGFSFFPLPLPWYSPNLGGDNTNALFRAEHWASSGSQRHARPWIHHRSLQREPVQSRLRAAAFVYGRNVNV